MSKFTDNNVHGVDNAFPNLIMIYNANSRILKMSGSERTSEEWKFNMLCEKSKYILHMLLWQV